MNSEQIEILQTIGLIWAAILSVFFIYHLIQSFAIFKMMKREPVAPAWWAWIPFVNNICIVRLVEDRISPRTRKWVSFLITVPLVLFFVVGFGFFHTHIRRPFLFVDINNIQGTFYRQILFMILTFIVLAVCIVGLGIGSMMIWMINLRLFKKYLGNSGLWIGLFYLTAGFVKVIGYYMVVGELGKEDRRRERRRRR